MGRATGGRQKAKMSLGRGFKRTRYPGWRAPTRLRGDHRGAGFGAARRARACDSGVSRRVPDSQSHTRTLESGPREALVHYCIVLQTVHIVRRDTPKKH